MSVFLFCLEQPTPLQLTAYVRMLSWGTLDSGAQTHSSFLFCTLSSSLLFVPGCFYGKTSHAALGNPPTWATRDLRGWTMSPAHPHVLQIKQQDQRGPGTGSVSHSGLAREALDLRLGPRTPSPALSFLHTTLPLPRYTEDAQKMGRNELALLTVQARDFLH